MARELNNQFEWVFAYVAEGWVNLRANDPERALPFLERGYDLCMSAEVPLMGPVTASFLSLALLDAASDRGVPNAADRKRALVLAEEAVKQGEEFRFRSNQPMRVAILSHALLADHRRQEALDRAATALESARRQAEPVSEVEALLALAQAQQSLGLEWRETTRAATSVAEQRELVAALSRCRRFEANAAHA